MTFSDSIQECLSKYASFSGRASRSEYWWFYLFTLLLCWGGSIAGAFATGIENGSDLISGLVAIGLLLPGVSSAARRLHDTGRSGWWMLISLTVVGIPFLYYFLASKGENQENQYGSPVTSA